jgi:hypothetical protein
MLNSNSLLFAFGAITFLVSFSWFKYAAMEVFKKELKSDQSDEGVWAFRSGSNIAKHAKTNNKYNFLIMTKFF